MEINKIICSPSSSNQVLCQHKGEIHIKFSSERFENIKCTEIQATETIFQTCKELNDINVDERYSMLAPYK